MPIAEQDQHGDPEGHRDQRAVLDEEDATAADQDEVEDQDGSGDDVSDLCAHGGASQFRSRKCSRPNVRPGVVTTRRAPSRMPGMKLLWCRESCRMVRVSPSPPRRTS